MYQQDLVSVVVTLYNGEKYLEETVRSILDSTYRPIEIFIVNDGSKDGSLNLAQKIAGSNEKRKKMA